MGLFDNLSMLTADSPSLIDELRHYFQRMVDEQEKTNALLLKLLEKDHVSE
jgi:hypothetical protein